MAARIGRKRLVSLVAVGVVAGGLALSGIHLARQAPAPGDPVHEAAYGQAVQREPSALLSWLPLAIEALNAEHRGRPPGEDSMPWVAADPAGAFPRRQFV